MEFWIIFLFCFPQQSESSVLAQTIIQLVRDQLENRTPQQLQNKQQINCSRMRCEEYYNKHNPQWNFYAGFFFFFATCACQVLKKKCVHFQDSFMWFFIFHFTDARKKSFGVFHIIPQMLLSYSFPVSRTGSPHTAFLACVEMLCSIYRKSQLKA